MQGSSTRPMRIGLWGLFDTECLGDALLLRITDHELKRRLPEARIRAFAPLGYLHPGGFDGPDPVEPLGSWTADRVRELAAPLDCVIVTGEVIRGTFGDAASCYGRPPAEIGEMQLDRFFIEGPGEACPVLWSAVGVPDELSAEEAVRVKQAADGRAPATVVGRRSLERLAAAGVGDEVSLVPDPLVLAPRVVPADVLDRRLRHLRHVGWYPEGPAVVVEGGTGGDARAAARAVASAVRGHPGAEAVIVPLRPGGADAADATAAHIDARRVPGPLSLEDAVAAIAAAEVFVAASPQGALIARALGTRTAGVDAQDHADSMEAAREAADAHFDRLAEEIRRVATPSDPEQAGETEALRRRIAELEERLQLMEAAHRARARRLIADASVHADLRRDAELIRRSRSYRATAWLRGINRWFRRT